MLPKAVKNEYGQLSSFAFVETEGWIPTENLRVLSEYAPPAWFIEQQSP